LNHRFDSFKEKFAIVFSLLFNLLWFFTDTSRAEIKSYISGSEPVSVGLVFIVLLVLFVIISYFFSKRVLLQKFLLFYAISFFLVSNVKYAISIPKWEN